MQDGSREVPSTAVLQLEWQGSMRPGCKTTSGAGNTHTLSILLENQLTLLLALILSCSRVAGRFRYAQRKLSPGGGSHTRDPPLLLFFPPFPLFFGMLVVASSSCFAGAASRQQMDRRSAIAWLLS